MPATFGISTMLGMPAMFVDIHDVRHARDVPAAKLETERGALSGSAGMAGKATAPIRAYAALRAHRTRKGRRRGGRRGARKSAGKAIAARIRGVA